MMRFATSRFALAAGSLAFAVAWFSCAGRVGTERDDEALAAPSSSAVTEEGDESPSLDDEAGATENADTVSDAGVTVAARAPVDAGVPADAGSRRDGGEVSDAGRSNLHARVNFPPIPAALPAPEAACAPGTGAAYLVSAAATLYGFRPETTTATRLGTLACPTGDRNARPWTMTLTQTDAYVLYTDWRIYRVSLETLACARTPYVSGQLGYLGDVGIGTTPGPGEPLIVYGEHDSVHSLATADLGAFQLSAETRVTRLPNIGYPVDIKVDGYGRLFAADITGNLLMVDARTGHVLGFDKTGLGAQGGWALLTYNDGLYFFTGRSGDVHRWDLTQKKASSLGAVDDEIVGAGAAPCLH